jgi:lipoprotein-anchoring transpeptidase ErfK/SrfK
MNQDTVSTIFGERTPMPYAIFYDGNVAIHYSDDFAQVGYEGGSHGCSQLRDYQAAKWLFEQVKRGDKVVVY